MQIAPFEPTTPPGLSLIFFDLHLEVTSSANGALILPVAAVWLAALLERSAWIADNLCIYLYPEANLGVLKVVFAAELIFMVWLLG